MRNRLILAGLAVALIAGCGSGSGTRAPTTPVPDDDPPPNSSKIDPRVAIPGKFASCEAYQNYLTDAFFDRVTKRLPCGFGLCAIGAPDPVALGIEGSLAAVNASFDSVSQTNTQIADIDEGDLVEADAAGNIYVLSQGRLIVGRGNPPEETTRIGELLFDGFPQEMLLDEPNQRLILISTVFGSFDTAAQRYFTQVWLVDVSDPATPSLDGQLQFEGLLLASRRHEDRIHLFTWRDLFLPDAFFENGGWDLVQQYHEAEAAGNADLVAQISAALRTLLHASISAQMTDYLPGYTATDGVPVRLDCASLAAPTITVDPAYTMLASFDSDGADLGIASIINNVGTVYVTASSAYLVQSSYQWWWDTAQADETAIHSFAIGDGAPEYRATGVIPGQARNNLYLSEHAGVLRAASHEIGYDADSGDLRRLNHLFVLEDDGQGALVEIGAVEGFQIGEDIFAVRFVGDRGYIVTFRQIDPLFTFDLSDPYNPRLMGELELPGFSTYMQPLDEQYLLTIGREGDNDGNIGPLALRIFDVADLSAPRLAHSFTLDDNSLPWSGYSPASHDYHAFNFHEGLLSLPFVLYGADWEQSFNGFVYFDVDTEAGIAELGRINHSDLLDAAYCQAFSTVCTDPAFWLNPLRSVIMTRDARRYVFTVSNGAVAVSAADDPSNVLASFLIEPP